MGAQESSVFAVVTLAACSLLFGACGSDSNAANGKKSDGGASGEGGTPHATAGQANDAGGAPNSGSAGEAGRSGGDEAGGTGGATAGGATASAGASGEGGRNGVGEGGSGEPPDSAGGAGGEGGGVSTPARDPRCDDATPDALAGTGSSGDPYLVCAAEQLALLGSDPYTLDRAYALGDDLDVSSLESFATIGEEANPLSGTFDGRGRSVSGLSTPLFAGIEDGSEVRDVSLSGEAAATTEPIQWGFLAKQNRGLVSGVHAEGTLAAPSHAGLLVGLNQGVIEGCSSSGTISEGGNHVGGLVGVNEGVVRRSFSTASVTATQRVGGLVGRQSTELASIEESYALGAVSGSRSVGGLLGTMFGGEIADSFARSSAVTGTEAGGLVGDVTGTEITITNTYAAASALSGEGAEGLVGEVGADSEYVVTASYFHESASGTLGDALSTSAMQTMASYDGWDFTDVWRLPADEYPTLRAFDR